MTNPIQPVAGVAATPQPAPAVPSRSAEAAGAAFTVEVSRAKSAPVYVYRLTETATGRVLVELPNEPSASDGPGSRLDAKA